MPSYFPTEDTHLNISRGVVKGTSVRNIFGYNATIPVGQFVPAWEANTVYTFPTANLAMDVVSSDPTDTDVTVLISGLDSDYNEVSDTINLNGDTTVTSNTEFFRINDVVTLSGNANGNISVTNSGTLYAKIRAGEGRNQASIYTVPAGCSFYLTRIDAFVSAGNNPKETTFRNYITLPNGVELRVAEARFLSEMHIIRVSPFKYTEKTDIQLQLSSVTSESFGSVFAEGVLIKDNLG